MHCDAQSGSRQTELQTNAVQSEEQEAAGCSPRSAAGPSRTQQDAEAASEQLQQLDDSPCLWTTQLATVQAFYLFMTRRSRSRRGQRPREVIKRSSNPVPAHTHTHTHLPFFGVSLANTGSRPPSSLSCCSLICSTSSSSEDETSERSSLGSREFL